MKSNTIFCQKLWVIAITRVNHRKSKHFPIVTTLYWPLGIKTTAKSTKQIRDSLLLIRCFAKCNSQCKIGTSGFVQLCTCAQTAGLIRLVILSDYLCERANPSFLSIFRKGTWRATMNSALLRTKHETSLSEFGNAWIFWICMRNIKSCI